MKKRKKRGSEQNPSEPVQIGPGIFAQNFGHWDVIQSARTAEEHASLMEDTKEFRRTFPGKMKDMVSELEGLLSKHNTFDLLANLTVTRLAINPETYKETTHKHGDALVEYATLLCLKSAFSSGNALFTGKAYEDVVERLDEVIETTFCYYGLEGAGELTPNNRLDELRRDFITSELVIRNPGYPHHLDELLISLFKPMDFWLLPSFGFTIGDLLSIDKGVRSLLNARFLARQNIVRTREKEFRAEFEEFKKSGHSNSECLRTYFESLQALPSDQSEEAIHILHAVMLVTNLGPVFAITVSELSEASGVATDRVAAALRLFSLRFGSVQPDFIWPKGDHQLKQRPFIQHEDRFMCPNVKLFIWAIRPMLERLLNPDTKACPKANKDVWIKYSDKRADFLEKESLRLFSLALRRATTHQNLKYQFKHEGKIQDGELDGLVIFDNTLILVETKAGVFPAKAKAGYREAIRENLKKLVIEAHQQALNAKDFIDASQRPIFQLTNGEQLVLDKSQFEQVFMVVVTLEPLDVFCANLHQMSDIGLFPSGELPWVLQFFDWRVIAETIEFPSQLVHYLRRRLRIHEIKKLETHDELDWFGCYLFNGLAFNQQELAGADSVRLGSFSTGFDDYYFYQQGIRKTPADMPRQKMPELFRKIILDIENSGRKGHSEAVCMLLDCNEAARTEFAKTLKRNLDEVDHDGTINNFTVRFSNVKFGVTCFVCPPYRVYEASFEFDSFVELMRYKAKADCWLGLLCISQQTQTVGSWLRLFTTWKEDSCLTKELAELEKKITPRWRKVRSRNLNS